MIVGKIYFGKYEVIRKLGSGGMSSVYLVRNTKLGNYWAVKKIRNGIHHEGALDEAHILKNLSHSAIPKVIDIEDDGDHVYILEEYVEGTTLWTYKVSREYISEELIVNWSLQLAKVLQYLHGQHPSPIIFRDIKPENIMITDQCAIKLVDFGIARIYKPEQYRDTVPFGSKGFAAPEQFGSNQTDGRTDIYALGVTIYFMITGSHLGEPPYHLDYDNPYVKEADPRLIGIIKRCCEPLPDERYQNVESLIEALEGLTTKKQDPKKFLFSHKKYKNSKNEKVSTKLQKSYSIGIMGVSYGVGATHSAIMLASSLAKQHTVALVSMDGSQSFKEIAFNLDYTDIKTQKTFSYKKVNYFWDVDYDTFIYNHKSQYEFIIWDFGHLLNNVPFLRYCDKQLIIAHGMDWKIPELIGFYEETEESDSNRSWAYIIPFCSKNEVSEIKKYIENHVYTCDFHKNPFRVGKDMDKWVRQLLMGK